MTIRNAVWAGALLLTATLATGCMGTLPPDAGSLPATELRAIQTRTYDQSDAKIMLKTVLDVLQDEGYVVDYGQTELGILHATKTITASGDQEFNRTGVFFPGAAGSRSNGGTAKLEATANITTFGTGTKVRISLQRITSFISEYYYGPIIANQAGTIVDAKVYQEFFAKLDRGVFLHKQGL
jgi:hypothetical protein